MLALLKEIQPRGISHITGGGFYENIPRSLGAGCDAVIDRKALRVPPIFKILRREGDIPERDMFNTYNMGVGMTVTVPQADADRALALLQANGEPDAYFLGEIAEGQREVRFQ